MSESPSHREKRPSAKASPKTILAMAVDPDPEESLRDAFSGSRPGLPEAQFAGFTCPPCGRFVRTDLDGRLWRARTGSPPRFCSPGCRQAAYRRRRAGVDEGVALQHRGGANRSLDARDKGARR